MEKEEKGGLRFSDLIKKGAEELKGQEKRSTDDSKKENETVRLSNLDYLKQRGKPRETEEEHPVPHKDEHVEMESNNKREEGISFRDFGMLRGDQKKFIRKGSSTTAGGGRATESADRSRERYSLKDFESFKTMAGTAARPSSLASRRDLDTKRLRMEEAKSGPTEERVPENPPGAIEPPKSKPEEGKARQFADDREKKEEAVSAGISVAAEPEDVKVIEKEVPSGPKEEAAPAVPESVAIHKKDVVIQAGAMDTDTLYWDALNFVQEVKRRISSKETVDIQPATVFIRIMSEGSKKIDDLSRLTARIIEEEDYNISHQVNVMIYSLKLGFGLNYSKERLLELGLSALMHDVGMFRIPESIALKTGKLTDREIDVIKTHTEIGRDILTSMRTPYSSLPDVAYEHHEREGGQGYPRGLKGNEIHEYARIVGLVDSYEAMTHNRPYRKALMQSISAKELIKSKSALYSQLVIKVFLKEISLYPLGSYVILNNKSIAEVVATDQNHPLRPTVKMLYDGEGNQIRDDIMIQLKENPLFFVVDGISPEELPVRR